MTLISVTYHHLFESEADVFHGITYTELETQINLLLSSGYSRCDPNNISSLISCATSTTEHGFILTFDDGYKSHLEAAKVCLSLDETYSLSLSVF